MKKIFLIAFTLILGLGSMCAQGNGKKSRAEMKKEFKEFKMKFIAQEVDLQDDQKGCKFLNKLAGLSVR